jgi:hypothetical protein
VALTDGDAVAGSLAANDDVSDGVGEGESLPARPVVAGALGESDGLGVLEGEGDVVDWLTSPVSTGGGVEGDGAMEPPASDAYADSIPKVPMRLGRTTKAVTSLMKPPRSLRSGPLPRGKIICPYPLPT